MNIKIKVKNKKTGEVIGFEWVDEANGRWRNCPAWDSKIIRLDVHVPKITEQYTRHLFTGRHDKEGKELHEGDWVENEYRGSGVIYEHNGSWRVKFEFQMSDMNPDESYHLYDFDDNELTLIE